MEKIQLERQFIMEQGTVKTVLADPDPEMSPRDVMKFYSRTYPSLVTASVVGPEYKGDKVVYSLKSVVGTKG